MSEEQEIGKTVLLTGANRGLGFAFAKHYAQLGWNILASCRKPEKADALRELATQYKNIAIHRMDVTDQSQVKTLALQLSGKPIDLIINNAGTYGNPGVRLGGLLVNDWLEVMTVNCIAPVLIVQEFLPNLMLSETRRIVFISSRMGSIVENSYGNAYYYRTSKTALNSAMKSLSIDLKDRDITCVCVDPGWVRTDLGGTQAPVSAEESVSTLEKLFHSLEEHDSGKFYTRLGEEIPW